MSSILKALRKLEEEKSARREGAADIARDILRLPHRRREERRAWFLPLGGAALLVSVAAVVTLLLMRGPDRHPPAPVVRAVQNPAPAPGTAVVPAPPAPAPAQEKPSAQTSPPAFSLRRLPGEELIIEEPIDHPPIPSLTETAPRVREKRTSTSSSRPIVPPFPSLPEAKPAPPAATGPSFILSGIVYQEDPDGRVAVINDLPVMTGTAIEGATVREILPDRVRLDFPDGRVLDLFLEP